MDLHGMKRKDLQTLCKKHGIPANLKNVEMAARLASLFEKQTGTETKISPDGIEDNLVVNKEAKKVTFSPENEVFEFTRSVKIRKRKNVKPRIQAQDLQQGGIELRRSKRNVDKGITVAGSSANESNTSRGIAETEKECSWPDVKVPSRSKRVGSSGITQDDCKVTELIDLEQFEDKDISNGELQMGIDNQDSFKLKKLRRRSTRLAANLLKSCEGETVLPSKRSKRLVYADTKEDELAEAVKHYDLELEKAPTPSMQPERNASELLVDGQAQKGDKQPKRTYGNDRENTRLLRSSKRTAVDNMLDQAISNSPKRCSIIHCEQDRASVDTVKKLNVDDEMQVHARLTMNYSRHDSSKNPVEKQTDETLDSLVKSSKNAERRMKRDRSAETGVDIEVASTQSNLRPKQVLHAQAQSLQEKASGFDLEARGSSKKSKTMNQECVKDKLQGTVEDLSSSSETKVAEFVMIAENVLDSSPGMSVYSSQTANTEEMNSEVVVGKCEDILELDTVLMVGVEEKKEEVRLAVSNPEAEQVSPTGHILVKDFSSTVVTEEDINTKEHNSVAKLANVEVPQILEKSSECWKEMHSNNDDEIHSLKKEVHAADLQRNFSEYILENKGAEEEMEISKAGCMSVSHCVNITPEKLFDEYAKLKPEDGGGSEVEARSTDNQDFVKYKPQGMAEDISSISETKVTEPGLISENFLDSTDSGDISPRRNTQKLNSELMEGEREEKNEQDTVSMAATKNEKEEASSLSVFLVKRSEVRSSDSEQGVPTDHSVVKDIAQIVISEEDTKTIFFSKSELKEHSCVAKLAEGDEIQENSAETWKEIHSSKNLEKGSLEKELQAANLHGNFSEYNTESNSAEEQSDISKVSFISLGQCVHLKTLDEVKDGSLEKPNQTISSERGCKLNALELSGVSLTGFAREERSGFSSTDFAREVNVSECFGKDEKKALSQILLVNKTTSSVLDESAIFTTPERNLMLMELVNENGTMRATDSVTLHNDEAVEPHYVVSITPEQFLDEAGKEEEHTAADFLDESDLFNNTSRCLVLGGSSQHVSRNEGDSIVVELHDVPDISTSPVRQFSMGDFKGDEVERNEENGSVELHCKSGSSTSPARRAHLGNTVSDGAENSDGNKAMERRELFESSGQLTCANSEQKEAVKTGEKVIAESHDKSALPNIPEDSELDEAAKSEEIKAVELLVQSEVFTIAENQLLLVTDEGMKADNVIAKSQEVSNVFTAAENHSLIGDFEPDVAEKGFRENKDVESLGESNISTNSERHLSSGDSGLDQTRKMEENTLATLEESFLFTFSETHQLSGNSEPQNAGKQEPKEVEFKNEPAFFSRPDNEKSDLSQYHSHHTSSSKVMSKDDSVVLGSHIASLDFSENTIIDSNGRIPSKLSSSNECHAEQETAGAQFIAKGSQGNSAVDAIQETSKQNRGHSPQVDSVNLFDLDNEKPKTILETERNFPFSSHVLELPGEGNSETIGEISSYLEVAVTYSMVSEEADPSSDVQNQINDGMEELAITDNDEAKEVTEAKETKNSEKCYEANPLLNSSGGSYVSGKTCILAGKEDEQLVFNSEVNLKNTCEKNGEDEETGPIATVFENAIAVSPRGFIVQNNNNEKAADVEMIGRETTPNPDEVGDSSEIKECLSMDESDTLSKTQVRGREPILVCKTQVKPRMHDDRKENDALNSKIVQNLNVTAPRTSKRQPLRDLKN